MHKILRSIAVAIVSLAVISCNTEKKTSEADHQHQGHDHNHEADHVNKGFESIPELSASVIQSLANYDYEEYYSHIMTKSQERDAAKSIENDANRKIFLKEFEFSLKEEKEYFDFLEKAIKEEGLDMANARVNELEIIDYKPEIYAPLALKEVIIPVMKGDFETDIVFVCIQLEGKWFLTAELGI